MLAREARLRMFYIGVKMKINIHLPIVQKEMYSINCKKTDNFTTHRPPNDITSSSVMSGHRRSHMAFVSDHSCSSSSSPLHQIIIHHQKEHQYCRPQIRTIQNSTEIEIFIWHTRMRHFTTSAITMSKRVRLFAPPSMVTNGQTTNLAIFWK